jgi:hypothetical protein
MRPKKFLCVYPVGQPDNVPFVRHTQEDPGVSPGYHLKRGIFFMRREGFRLGVSPPAAGTGLSACIVFACGKKGRARKRTMRHLNTGTFIPLVLGFHANVLNLHARLRYTFS